ncbi:hypothetical protein HO173_008803 [Letharia columbiana]|uniref:Uncharacterized protein n=1 Tax=Letharia columbiana TaxID=112416 RepID=A0A8H6FQX2_9LECA|nr:uncharacterized protein HO173_008803 [Letharia columbiana]KAF6233047.1 hypothetical protein HO173_008803 [Letharia columbiana]
MAALGRLGSRASSTKANGTVENKIACWKRKHGSTHRADALEEFALQLNSTYHRAITAIPYEVVFNRKPKHKRAPVGMREVNENEIEDQEVENEIDDGIVHASVDQEAME